VKALGMEIDVFCVKAHLSKWEYVKAPFALFRLLRREKYDLLHAQHTYTLYITWLVKNLLRLKTPLVLTFREPEFMKQPGYSPDKKGFFGRLITSRTMKRKSLFLADHVIAVWKGLMDALDFHGPYEEMACGIDLDRFHPIPRAEARAKIGWPQDETILFFPADRGRRTDKGADLVEAAARILEERGVRLTVHYASNIPHEEMPYYMAAADVVVHPARFDASPNAVKEGMAVGTPVVTTPVGDVVQVSHDLASVLWVDVDPKDIADKIEAALRLDRSLEGRERLESLGLSERSVAERLFGLYSSWGHPPGSAAA
jgi:glycosyltransferase involved in cell wall biosynthesis